MEKPIIGMESIFFSILISIILIVYAFLFYPVVKRSFKLGSNNRWNSFLVLVSLIILALCISLPFSNTIFYLFMPLNWYLIVVIGTLIGFFYIFALISKKFRDQINNESPNLDRPNSANSKFSSRQEIKRKFIHFCAILYISSWIIEPLVFYGVKYIYENVAYWATFEEYHNALYLFEDRNVSLILRNGLIAHFFIILCTLFFNLDIELIHLRFPNSNYPLKRKILSARRISEENDISHSVLLLLGLLLSSLILTYTSDNIIKGIYAQMAVISITVLSDMFAALIGKKFGKHNWSFAKDKSYEGSIVGFIIGFFVAMIFVGPFLALLGSLIFIFTDIFLAKLNISDNISNPILISILFKILIEFVDPLIVILPFIKVW